MLVAYRLTFPYPDHSFDLVIATSVFTHLLTEATDHYLAEAARVLSPGGRMFSTWFLVDPRRLPDPSRAIASFSPTDTAAWIVNPTAPESAVAYDVTWLGERLLARGFRLRGPIHHGSWTGHAGRSTQDIVVAERP